MLENPCCTDFCQELQKLFLQVGVRPAAEAQIALFTPDQGCSRMALSDFTDAVEQTVTTGHQIAVHTALDGTAVSILETITSHGVPVVDTLTDPYKPLVTIPYQKEDGTTENIQFAIPLPSPVSSVQSIDFMETANANEFTVQIVYVDDQGTTHTITDTTPVTIPAPPEYVLCDGSIVNPTTPLLSAVMPANHTGYMVVQDASGNCIGRADVWYNEATNDFVVNASSNSIVGNTNSSILGGTSNAADGRYLLIGGGATNKVSSPASGGYNTVVNGYGNTVEASSYATVVNGSGNKSATGSSYLLQSGQNNSTEAGSHNAQFGSTNRNTRGSYNIQAGASHKLGQNAAVSGNAQFGSSNDVWAGSYNFQAGYSHQNETSAYNGQVGYNHRTTRYGNFQTGHNQVNEGQYAFQAGANNSNLGNASGNMQMGYSHETTGGSYNNQYGYNNHKTGGSYNSQLGSGNSLNGGNYDVQLGHSHQIDAAATGVLQAGYDNHQINGGSYNFQVGRSNRNNVTGAGNNSGQVGYNNRNNAGGLCFQFGDSNVINTETYVTQIGRSIPAPGQSNVVQIAGPSQRLGFYGAAGVTRQALPANPTPSQISTVLRNLNLVS